MTANLTSMHDFINTMRRRVPPLHPSAKVIVHEWLDEADAVNDANEVARLLDLVGDKIVLELRWQAEDRETAHFYRDAYYLRRADRYAGVASDWVTAWCRPINAASATRAAEYAEFERQEIARYGHLRSLEEYLATERIDQREVHHA